MGGGEGGSSEPPNWPEPSLDLSLISHVQFKVNVTPYECHIILN